MAGDFSHGGGIVADTATLTSSTVSSNYTLGENSRGGGISAIAVTLTDSTVSGNSTAGFFARSGGIAAITATLTSSTVSGNSTLGVHSSGGGISAFDALILTDSTVSGNYTLGVDSRGGGILATTATLTSSAVSGNRTVGAFADGGGILASAVTLTASTVSGNTTAGDEGDGGGIKAYGAVTLITSTVTGNHTYHANSEGGGVMVVSLNNPPLTITGSIVAGNTAAGGSSDIEPRTTSQTFDYSLIGDNHGMMLAEAQTADANGNLVGSAAGGGVIDPLLAPLRYNGGPTQTHALLPGSPAIDAGDPLFMPPSDFDQRGAPFLRDDGSGIDIGAVERQTVANLNLVVDTTLDEHDGDYSAGDVSLREAIGLANGSVGAEAITFGTLFNTAQMIALASQLPTITDALTITGPGQDLLTLDAGGGTDPNIDGDGYRLFNIDDGDDNNQIVVEISGLTLTGGDVASDDFFGNGGAIRNRENLTVTSSTLSGNTASSSGGGIDNFYDGTATITSSTLSGNTASFRGGGIYNRGGRATLTVTSSTLSGNTASLGGGIDNFYGTLTVTSSTLSGNTAIFRGGGILNNNGTTTVTSSTLSGNTTTNSGGGIYNWGGTTNVTSSTLSGNTADFGGGIFNGFGMATVTVTSSTLSGNTASSSGGGIDNFTAGTANVTSSIVAGNTAGSCVNVCGVLSTNTFNLIDVDPLLGPLADNGGPTQTHALLPGSPAIDAGDPDFIPPPDSDQRGAPRVADGDGDLMPRIDIGAFERLPTIQLSSYGETHIEGFDSLGPAGSALPTGWTASTGHVFHTAIIESFPTATVASGTYNAGSGGDRTLATGNIDRTATNSLQLSAQLSGPNDVRAVVLEV